MFSVALFGHRRTDDLRALESKLYQTVVSLLEEHELLVFYVGRNGDFDESAASIIKGLSKIYGKERILLVLVLPYVVKDIEYYEKYYDEIIIPPQAEKAHYNRAFLVRNRWMADHADLIVANVEHKSGGAYTALSYAKSKGKPIINFSVK